MGVIIYDAGVRVDFGCLRAFPTFDSLRRRGPFGRGFGDLAIFTMLNLSRTPANPSQTKESRPPLVWQMRPSVA